MTPPPVENGQPTPDRPRVRRPRTQASGEPPLYVVPYRPARFDARFLPPLLMVLVAVPLLIYRLRTPDWHWSWPEPRPSSSASPLARSASTPAEVAVATNASRSPAQAARDAERRVLADAAWAAKGETPASVLALNGEKPKDDKVAKQALDDIEREAERIKAERAELEAIKSKEGERLAKIPPKPDFGIGRRGRVNPARLQRMMEQMHAQALADMNRHQRQFEAMARQMEQQMRRRMRQGGEPFGDWPPPPAGMGFPQDGFRPMLDAHREIQRHFDEMLRAQQQFFQNPPQPFGPPPRPHAPGSPPAAGQPDVQTFSFDLPGGGRATGYRMRWGFQDQRN